MKLLLVGCGKMGSALLDRWAATPELNAYHFDVVEPGRHFTSSSRIQWHEDPDSLTRDYVPDVIVFAVKPQELAALLPLYRKRFDKQNPLYISIAAGKTINFLRKHLGNNAKIIRVMPNTPAMICEGMSVIYADTSLPADAKKIAEHLLRTVGAVEWVKDESLMDTVTALSGSGPAYVFLFAECLAKAAISIGLEEGLVKMLVLQTVYGSALLARQSDESLEQLRKNVTSPGGTTEAALAVLMKDNGFEKLLKQAVAAAAKRSRELAE